MKLSTCSSIVGTVASALCFLGSNPQLALASSVVSNENMTAFMDTDAVAAAAPFVDPDMNRLSLEGIDPTIPLTDDEAAFLESTIQDIFNEFTEHLGMDLYAESVSVGTTAIRPASMTANTGSFSNMDTITNVTEGSNNSNSKSNSNNLRGGNRHRHLEREIRGTPQQDWNWCWYRSGPKYKQWIPGCEFNVELYFCCRCWMCIDDDYALSTRMPTMKPTMGFYERWNLFMDDDWKDNRPPTQNPTQKPTAKPTMAPTKQPEPEFEKEILKKLKKGRFGRFHNVKKVRFGHGY